MGMSPNGWLGWGIDLSLDKYEDAKFPWDEDSDIYDMESWVHRNDPPCPELNSPEWKAWREARNKAEADFGLRMEHIGNDFSGECLIMIESHRSVNWGAESIELPVYQNYWREQFRMALEQMGLPTEWADDAGWLLGTSYC